MCLILPLETAAWETLSQHRRSLRGSSPAGAVNPHNDMLNTLICDLDCQIDQAEIHTCRVVAHAAHDSEEQQDRQGLHGGAESGLKPEDADDGRW